MLYALGIIESVKKRWRNKEYRRVLGGPRWVSVDLIRQHFNLLVIFPSFFREVAFGMKLLRDDSDLHAVQNVVCTRNNRECEKEMEK
jgi:hypothetical protein